MSEALSAGLSPQESAITVLGGLTAVIDLGGLRIVSDPTFDDAGPHGYLTKTAGPAVGEDGVGRADLVLVSHDTHPDNLDERGRAFAKAAPLVLTGPLAAARLGSPAVGLASWTSHSVPRADGGGDLTVLAVPAVHGPEDGERDADGNVNCEVTGFVLSGQGLPTVYVSGDNASIRTVAEISRRCPPSTRPSCTRERHASPRSSTADPCPWTAAPPLPQQPSWARAPSSRPTTTPGPTSPKGCRRSSRPSTKPACPPCCGPHPMERGCGCPADPPSPTHTSAPDEQGTTHMPFVRIDLIRGRRPDEVRAIADATHQALVDVLGIPERDRFQVVTEHDADHVIALDAGLGFERTDRLVMIQIFTQSGRTTEVKQRVYRNIAERLEPLGIGGEDVFIGIVENGSQDWSFGFGRAQYVEGVLPVPGR